MKATVTITHACGDRNVPVPVAASVATLPPHTMAANRGAGRRARAAADWSWLTTGLRTSRQIVPATPATAAMPTHEARAASAPPCIQLPMATIATGMTTSTTSRTRPSATEQGGHPPPRGDAPRGQRRDREDERADTRHEQSRQPQLGRHVEPSGEVAELAQHRLHGVAADDPPERPGERVHEGAEDDEVEADVEDGGEHRPAEPAGPVAQEAVTAVRAAARRVLQPFDDVRRRRAGQDRRRARDAMPRPRTHRRTPP